MSVYEISTIFSSLNLTTVISPLLISNSTASTSNTTGCFRLAGGIALSNTTDASSHLNGGTFTTAGGMAVAKKMYIGGITTLSDTTSSSSNTIGSLCLAGSIALSNTTDASSVTNGGTVTSAGGMSIAKKVFVGGITSLLSDLNCSGNVTFSNTTSSTSSSSAAVVLNGGLSINNSTDATGTTNGGTFTTPGGASIGKKLFVGSDLRVLGNVVIDGTLNIGGSTTNIITTPTVTPTGTSNVVSTTTTKSVLNQVGSQYFYFVLFSCTPTTSGLTTTFTFPVPNIVSNFTTIFGIQVQTSGYTANSNCIFQITATTVIGTTNASVSFTSIDTSVHYIHLTLNY